jgi:SnoaL-like domain
MSDFASLLSTMTQAAAGGDGAATAACFTTDGVYHDCFYGSFRGAAIKEMVEDYFHRDGGNFIWDLHDPIADGSVGYARYVFSYDSRLAEARGKRAVFEGVSICRLEDGLIKEYREVANAISGLQQLGFGNERLAKLIARESTALRQRAEAIHHLD